jgi:hypothetical protein
VAEQLGQATLSLVLDQSGFKAGLDAAVRESRRKADQIANALNARQARVSQLDKDILRLGKEKLSADASRSALIQQQIGLLRVEQQQQQRGISVLKDKLSIQQRLNREQAAAASVVGGGGVQALASNLGGVPGLGGAAQLFAAGPVGVAVAGAAALAAGIGTIATFSIKAADEMQKLNQQILLLTKSQEITDAVIANLRDYALATPFDTPELAETTKLLLAYGLSAADAVDATKRLGDVATVTGQDINDLALNFGQIVSQGRTYSVDLRQFALRGVPIFETLAQITNKSVSELKNLEGGIPADQVVEAFRRMTSEGGKFFEGGAKGGTALNRELATITDNSKRIGNVIGTVLTPALVAGITAVASGVGDTATALEKVKANADKALANPLVARIFGLGGQVAGKLAQLTPFGIAADIAGIAAGGGEKSSGPPAIRQDLVDKAEELLGIAAARGKAEAEIVKPAKDNYEAVKRTLGLSGNQLAIVRSQLEIEAAKGKELKAQAALIKSFTDGTKPADREGLIANAEAAGIALKTAQEQAGQALKNAAQEAKDIIKTLPEDLRIQVDSAAKASAALDLPAQLNNEFSDLIDRANTVRVLSEENLLGLSEAYAAYDQRLSGSKQAIEDASLGVGRFSAAALAAVKTLSNAVRAADSARLGNRTAVEGAFKFLSDANQSNIIDLALKDINNKSFGLGIDLSKVDVSTPESIFEALNAVRSLEGANKALEDALANQTTATQELAAKDWQVQVNVDAGGGTSEVILQ